MLATGALVENRYTLQGLLHTSRETRVFAAADRGNGAPVVVKFFSKGHYLADLYYTREVQFYKACVGIAGIPVLLATGDSEGQKYLITDFVGRSLSDILATGRTISGPSLMLLARKLLVILQATHGRDFLHLSVAPDNILIDFTTSQVSLVDFKSSQSLTTPQEDCEEAQGKAKQLLFTSSDQLHGQTPSFRSDLESLSYVLMYLQMGSLPWKTALRTESHATYLHSRRRFAHSEFLRDVSEGIRELWAAATALQPGEKPNYEKLKAMFLTPNNVIRLEERGRKEDTGPELTRGSSLRAIDTAFRLPERRQSEIHDIPPPSPLRDEARKRTAKKEGPQFSPSLRTLISHIRDDY